MSLQTACPRGCVITVFTFVWLFPTVVFQKSTQIADASCCILVTVVPCLRSIHWIWLYKRIYDAQDQEYKSKVHMNFFYVYIFSCPGSSIPDLGQWVSQSVTATLEFRHKEWLLTLETFQTFYQRDVWTKKTKRQKDKKTKEKYQKES